MPTVRHNTSKAEDIRQAPLKNCLQFNREMLEHIDISNDPNPWLMGAPKWSNPSLSVLNDPGSDVCQPDHAEWRSDPLRLPHTLKFAKCDEGGNWTTASIYANVTQKVHERDPRINFERHGWDKNGDEVEMIAKYTLTIQEAGYLARALLLLIDLALGTSDDLGEVDHK
ncbi:hypothetical protein [Rhodococcus qingshengii]|uniref:hypothetical protein n=1 Tax=Rhodococcus qingshengii TaxID=334542 RepID=UPI000AC864EA|nr:hypothetical protein [Rhodococcus qingshengii]MCZ4546631.1 hypothetical protein [Rhodococcus qingshengii]